MKLKAGHLKSFRVASQRAQVSKKITATQSDGRGVHGKGISTLRSGEQPHRSRMLSIVIGSCRLGWCVIGSNRPKCFQQRKHFRVVLLKLRACEGKKVIR